MDKETKLFDSLGSKTKSFEKGQIILKPDVEVEQVFLLREGFVRQYWLSEEGEDITIHIFKPGAVFPLMLVIGKKPNRHYFEAFTETRVEEFSAAAILSFLKSDLNQLYEFTVRFAQGMDGLALRIEMLAARDSSAKMLLFLDYLSKSFGSEKDGRIQINLALTQSQIASWIGTKRETVTRALEIYRQKGVVSFQKGLISLDKDLFSQEISRFKN